VARAEHATAGHRAVRRPAARRDERQAGVRRAPLHPLPGDLSGGQYLGPAIAAAYGLSGDGHRFFVFEGVDPPAFRARYRALLDEAPWSRAEQDAFLTEGSQAYRLNIDVLDELRERWA
jgi:heme oxygenase